MKAMTLGEKIGQLNLINPGGAQLTGSATNTAAEQKIIDGRVGAMFGTQSIEQRRTLQTLAVRQSRLAIPLFFASDVIHGYRTAFPLPIALSCSWDEALIQRTAHLAATDARGDGIDLTFSPMVDVSRDPRWGRVAEGAGESTWWGGRVAAAMVRGYQGTEADSLQQPDRMIACVKHFAGYGAAEGGREYASVNLGPHELHQTYLPPFLAAIEAGVGSVMPGFNTIDRVPVTADPRLLHDLLVKRWGFDGLVISDYTAINELIDHGLGDLATVAARAITAGVDMDMVGEGFLNTLERSTLESSTLGRSAERPGGLIDAIDRACRRVLLVKERLGLFEDPFRSLDPVRSKSVHRTPECLEEARRMVSASCVLLKNQNEVLPLAGGQRIALIGPLADDVANLPGTWSVSARGPCISVAAGLREVLGSVANTTVARGCDLVDDPTLASRLNVFGPIAVPDGRSGQQMLDEAVAVAGAADVVVLVVGEAKEHSGECSSRTELSLPPPQRKLVEVVAAVGRPVVLVVMAGRPLTIGRQVDAVDAVLYAWYGGTQSGLGIADLLVGNVSPSGRLTMTFPRSVGQIPVHHDALPTGRPLNDNAARDDSEFEKFRSCYIDESNRPLFPFGHGLTYTTFEYVEPNVDFVEHPQPHCRVRASVRNIGRRPGREVMQLYVTDPVAPVSGPTMRLIGYRAVELNPGEVAEVQWEVHAEELEFVRANSITDYQWWFEPGEFIFAVGPDAQRVRRATMNWPTARPNVKLTGG